MAVMLTKDRLAMTLRSVSYGGGVQSTALLVLAAQGRIDYPLFVFANTGDRSEHPDTLAYVKQFAIPYAQANGIELLWRQRTRRDGTHEDLHDRLDRGNTAIPVRRSKDGPPMSRSCTTDFKIKVIEKVLKERGATKEHPAIVALGISVDEVERASPGIDPRSPLQIRTYPLLEKSPLDRYSDGLRLTRQMCKDTIVAGGLPVPSKSSCYFCPFHDADAWRNLQRKRADLFADACNIEDKLTANSSDGRPVYLTRSGRPLRDVFTNDQQAFDGMDGCDTGWCMT